MVVKSLLARSVGHHKWSITNQRYDVTIESFFSTSYWSSALVWSASAVLSSVKVGVATATGLLLVAPARHLFLDGPYFLGCWRGMPLSDVCSGLTGVSAQIWLKNPEECQDVIDRHVWSFVVPIYVLAYFAVAGRVLWYVGKKVMK